MRCTLCKGVGRYAIRVAKGRVEIVVCAACHGTGIATRDEQPESEGQ
jgi:DnaJ-class molecular chaperone